MAQSTQVTTNGSRNRAIHEASTGPAAVCAAAISLLDQCEEFVRLVGAGVYGRDSAVLKGGTIGKHIRHTLDHFRAVLDGAAPGEVVDYDRRERHVPMETDPAAALGAIAALRERLLGVSERDIATAIRVRIMLAGDGSGTELDSTLGRELAFAAHHAVHHHAMLSAIAAEFGVVTAPEFGKAPSTICFERGSR